MMPTRKTLAAVARTMLPSAITPTMRYTTPNATIHPHLARKGSMPKPRLGCGWILAVLVMGRPSRLCSMSLKEDVVLPATHSQQNLADQRHVMPMMGVDRGLGRRTDRDIVARHVVGDIEYRQGTTGGRSLFRPDQRRPGCQLPGRDPTHDHPHL